MGEGGGWVGGGGGGSRGEGWKNYSVLDLIPKIPAYLELCSQDYVISACNITI